jgi:dTDP-4-dehydrorhamnose reductase
MPLGSVLALGRKDFDLSQPERLAAELHHIAPELIVNAAAYTAVDQAESESELAFAINAEAPRVIANWAAEHQVPLIHFSSDYVFDGSGSRRWREDDPPSPLSNYDISKLAGDTAIRAASGPHLIVRTSWVYAAKGANFLRTILRLTSERNELRIVADQYGAPTSARLIAGAVGRIIGSDSSAIVGRFAAAK